MLQYDAAEFLNRKGVSGGEALTGSEKATQTRKGLSSCCVTALQLLAIRPVALGRKGQTAAARAESENVPVPDPAT